MSTPEWFLQHGRQYPTRFGSIGVMHLSGSPEAGTRPMVLLSVGEDRGPRTRGRFGVGDEFLVGPEIWRVVSITGVGSPDYVVHVVYVGMEGDLEEDDGWDYYLSDRGSGGDAERAGQVMRVRTGDDLRNGFVATEQGGWASSNWLSRVLEGGERGRLVRISLTRARALLTSWVAARRSVRLPADVRPLGSLVSGGLWDYFLLAPEDENDELDGAGDVLRCTPGGPFDAGWRLAETGEWVPDGRLQREWAESRGDAYPISERVAAWLMTWWVRRGRLSRLPGDVHPTQVPWQGPIDGDRTGGDWEFFAVRPSGESATPGKVTGRILAHRWDTSYEKGFAMITGGRWNPTGDLLEAVVLEDPGLVVEPISEQRARDEISRRFGAESFVLPSGTDPSNR